MQKSRTDDADKTRYGKKAGPKMEREEAYKEAGPMMQRIRAKDGD